VLCAVSSKLPDRSDSTEEKRSGAANQRILRFPSMLLCVMFCLMFMCVCLLWYCAYCVCSLFCAWHIVFACYVILMHVCVCFVDTMCYYLKRYGKCRHGERCWYAHSESSPKSEWRQVQRLRNRAPHTHTRKHQTEHHTQTHTRKSKDSLIRRSGTLLFCTVTPVR